MFKILILQAWYNWSHEALEKQVNIQLERNSITVSLGSSNIIDASDIEAKQSRKRKGKENNTQDSEASYNVKTAADGKRKTTYGFKAHANVDEDGFVKKMTFTSGNVHDSQEFDKLPDCGRAKDKLKTCGEVYADSTYANKTNDKKLGKQNNKVLHRAYRNTSLTQVQKQENKQRSSPLGFFYDRFSSTVHFVFPDVPELVYVIWSFIPLFIKQFFQVILKCIPIGTIINFPEEFIADITVLFGYMDIINLNTKNYVIAMKIIFTRFINKDRVYIFAHNFWKQYIVYCRLLVVNYSCKETCTAVHRISYA